jgi:hypothetical protein
MNRLKEMLRKVEETDALVGNYGIRRWLARHSTRIVVRKLIS